MEDLDKELIENGFYDTGVVSELMIDPFTVIIYDGFKVYLVHSGTELELIGCKNINDVKALYRIITGNEL